VIESLHSPAFLTLQKAMVELRELARALSDFQFGFQIERPFKSSVGAHFRHCVDHLNALVVLFEKGYVDYEDRKRGEPYETNKGLALAKLDQVEEKVFAHGDLHFKINDTVKIATSSVQPCGSIQNTLIQSTLGREIYFVASHTVHHIALMKIQVALMGVDLNESLGLALGTQKWQKEVESCAL
jgi:hypothetical protein